MSTTIGDLRSAGGAVLGRDMLEAVVANAADAVIIAEPAAEPSDVRIVYVNAAFTRLTGYTLPEVLGRSPRLLQGPGTSPATRAKMRVAIENVTSLTVDIVNYRKDGSDFIAEIGLTPVLARSGACTHWVAIARDVTERKRDEEQQLAERLGAERHAALVLEIEERERAQAQLAYRAVHDDLTGLHNRAYFMQQVEAAIARAQRDPTYAFSLLYLDLDRFKQVNETLGHRIGDLILRDVARRFEPLAGSRDTLARVGGDEFGLLIDAPDDPDEAVTVAGRLLMEVAKRPRFRVDDVVISAHIGIVHSTPEIVDAELLVRNADIARARCAVLDRAYTVFTPAMLVEAETAQRTRNDLYGAVERGEMRLYYQPLVDIAAGGVYGFEGLVRWQHPVRGLVMPDDFIPAAEETGIIVELGRWVLLEGCRKARDFSRLAGKSLTMSLNVSSQQLLHPRFLDHVQEALASSGIDPGTLQLEITESVFLAGGAVVGAVFARIRALSIQIAFDDFGTGYSSLSYLERFQIDTLKIDKSFVARIHDASAKSEILRMIIALAHALGVDIVAEGVESRAQRDALGHLGCTHLQGYLFSRPISEESIARLLFDANSDSAAILDALLEETITDASALLSPAERSELRGQVEAAIETHELWLDRLRTAVATGRSELDLAQVARDDLCPIGIWLSSTISPTLRTMPLYYVTKSRHAVFHRSAARLIATAVAQQSEAALSMRPDGDMTKVAASLLRTLHDWLGVATAERAVTAIKTPEAPCR